MEKHEYQGINFIGRRKIWYIISAILIIISIGSFAIKGLNYGIDFTGGNIIQLEFKEKPSLEETRKIVSSYVEHTPSVQTGEGNIISIRTTELSEEDNEKLIAEIKEKVGPLEVEQNDKIGPVIGSELVTNAIKALVIASVLMLIYITIRFKFFYALSAVLALLHDVVIAIGIVSILQLEVDSTFIAAILTILGYSINANIVIFDRVRENVKKAEDPSFPVLVNNSINQTLARSINTNLAVIFLLASLLFLGGDTTKVFSFILLVGVVAGVYSSIALSGSLLTDFITWDKNNKDKKKGLNSNHTAKGKKNISKA